MVSRNLVDLDGKIPLGHFKLIWIPMEGAGCWAVRGTGVREYIATFTLGPPRTPPFKVDDDAG